MSHHMESFNKKDFKGSLSINVKVLDDPPFRIETQVTALLDDDGDAIITIYSLVIPYVQSILEDMGHVQKTDIVKLLHDKKDA